MRIIVHILLALIVTENFSQGRVDFNNLAVDAPILMPNGTGPGAAGRAQLYLFSEATYSPVGPIQPFLTSSPEATKYVLPVYVVIPEVPPYETATLQVRAWVDAPNWESALLRGQSNDVDVMLMPEGEVALWLHGLQSFSLVPEPSTPTLWFLSAAVLFLFRRPGNASQ